MNSLYLLIRIYSFGGLSSVFPFLRQRSLVGSFCLFSHSFLIIGCNTGYLNLSSQSFFFPVNLLKLTSPSLCLQTKLNPLFSAASVESLADYLVIYQSLINQGIFRTGESNALTSQRGFSTPTCLLTIFWFPVVVAEAARPADFVILGCREGPTKKTKPPFLLLFPPCLEEEMMCLTKLLVSRGMFRRKLGPPHWKQT